MADVDERTRILAEIDALSRAVSHEEPAEAVHSVHVVAAMVERWAARAIERARSQSRAESRRERGARMKLHERIEEIREHVRGGRVLMFDGMHVADLLTAIDRLTAQVAALASLAERRGVVPAPIAMRRERLRLALGLPEGTSEPALLVCAEARNETLDDVLERLRRAHDAINERRRDAEDRGERLEEVEWLDRLDTLLAGAETARYGERRWQDRAWREGVERAIGIVEQRAAKARGTGFADTAVSWLEDVEERLRGLLGREARG